MVARWAHNPEVEGSNPSPATIIKNDGVCNLITDPVIIYSGREINNKGGLYNGLLLQRTIQNI